MPPGDCSSWKLGAPKACGAAQASIKKKIMKAKCDRTNDPPHTFPPDLTAEKCGRRRSWSHTFIIPIHGRATTAAQIKSCRLLNRQGKSYRSRLRSGKNRGSACGRYCHTNEARLR